jgi:hypothetical protein
MGVGTLALRGVLAALAGGGAALALAGCGGSPASDRGARSGPGEFPEYIAQAESTFRPADYGIETWEEDTTGAVAGTVPDSAAPPEAASPDTIPGFRVQVAITEEIDKAGFLRDSLSAAFPDDWVYVVHHPPYYKVRIGNFSERYLAEGFLDGLKRHGYPDAWIVPDRVLRNPPPRPLPAPPDSADSTTGADTLR